MGNDKVYLYAYQIFLYLLINTYVLWEIWRKKRKVAHITPSSSTANQIFSVNIFSPSEACLHRLPWTTDPSFFYKVFLAGIFASLIVFFKTEMKSSKRSSYSRRDASNPFHSHYRGIRYRYNQVSSSYGFCSSTSYIST